MFFFNSIVKSFILCRLIVAEVLKRFVVSRFVICFCNSSQGAPGPFVDLLVTPCSGIGTWRSFGPSRSNPVVSRPLSWTDSLSITHICWSEKYATRSEMFRELPGECPVLAIIQIIWFELIKAQFNYRRSRDQIKYLNSNRRVYLNWNIWIFYM